MPRVCHIITGLKLGGAERALHSLLAGGLAASHDCHVISLTDAGSYGALISELGVPVHCLGMSPGGPRPRVVFRLWSILRRLRPDVLQGWMYHGNLAATVGRLMLSGRPAVVWNVRQSLYDIAAEKRGMQFVIRLSCWLSRTAAAILYNSRMSRGQHEALGFDSRSGRIIANGFDPEIWRPDPKARAALRKSLGLTEATPVLGYVGRFNPLKDIPTLLSALQDVTASDPKVHIVLVGLDLSPATPALTPYFRALPSERIHVLGNRTDMPDVFPAFDLLCLSSRAEGFPNVLGEAMAVGVPVIATDVGDNADVVGDTGWIVPPADSRALSTAILDALAEGSAARGERRARARQRIIERFSLTAALDRYSQLYLDVSARH
ncbi:MAG TPA: glycosyltransferase [Caulobacteraceae bacterium]|nr:glycosyltransferase [Caulobacteraceae bacterium]